MKKYKLTNEVNTIGFHRIVALRDIPRYNVKKGDLGGFVESERNFSQDGDAWVGENAWVCDNALVSENAFVSGNALVSGNARVYGYAQIYGNAYVYENSRVCGNTLVFGDSFVGGNSIVSGNAKIFGAAWVSGEAKIYSNEDYITFQIWWVFGTAITWTRSNNMWKTVWLYGTAKELLAKAEKEGGRSFREYKRLVDYVESILKDESSGEKKQIHRDSKGRFCKIS